MEEILQKIAVTISLLSKYDDWIEELYFYDLLTNGNLHIA